MKRAVAVLITLVAVGVVGVPPVASAAAPPSQPAGPPPLPKEVRGKTVKLYATGVAIPTQYAFAGKKMFIAGGAEGEAKGGIYVRKPGSKAAIKIPGTGNKAFGVAWKKHRLYASLGDRLMVYGKWNGKRFRHKRKLFKKPRKSFTGFNGVAFGPDGRLYVGTTMESDHAASNRRYANSVISMKRNGKGIKIVSKGLRQPWMMAFVKGQKNPVVSDLAQDAPEGTMARDLLVRARPKSNFGFPTCTWEALCPGFSKPLMIFPAPHTSPMGIATKGKKLYVALFGGLGQGPEVISTDTKGSMPKPVLTGFVAPVLSVASHKGYLYAGDLTGRIYRVHN